MNAVADPLPGSRDAARKSFPNAALCSGYDELEYHSLDALLVASPPSTHLAILNWAMPRRIPVFIEKPFLLRGEIGGLKEPDDAGRLIMPNFNRRWWPAYQRIRDICSSGRLGRLRRAEFALHIDVGPWLLVTSHRIDRAEGGALYDLASSQFDLIQYVLGHKIARLDAHSHSVQWPNDDIQIEAQLENGLPVGCRVSYSRRNRETIEIVGDGATVRIGNPNCAVHVEARRSVIRDIVGWAEDAMVFGPKALLRERSMLHYTIRSALAEFFSALRERRPFSPNFSDAIENDRCLEAAARSLGEKIAIKLSSAGTLAHG